jgi:hypothetical protein
VNKDLGKIRKEAIVTYFGHLPGGTEENDGSPQSG